MVAFASLSDRNSRLRRYGRWLAPAVIGFFILYYLLGMAWVHEIDDDPDFVPRVEDLPPGASATVAVTTRLIDREINTHRWVANDPFFLPGAALDNMPGFQQGIISALGRFAFELTDQLGRTRGSSKADPDLAAAAGELQYEGSIWLFDFSTSLLPTTPSHTRYNKARRALERYNERLAAGEATFERRADNLLATLDRIALDLGSSSAALDSHIRESDAWLIDFAADDIFYGVKGQTYAYYLLLRGLQIDFQAVIEAREIGAAWDQMLESLRAASGLDPILVMNGAPGSYFPPSHLAEQGFYLLRARTQLREITNILLK